MKGYIDEILTPRVNVTFFDVEGNGKDYPCVIDTGFTEEIYLPIKFAEKLKLEILAVETIMLADGTITKVGISPLWLKWNNEPKEVVTLIGEGSDILIGVKLLVNYELRINFLKGTFDLLTNEEITE